MLTGGVSLWLLPQIMPWEFVNDLGLARRPFVGVWMVDLFPDDRASLVAGSVVFAVALVAVTVGWHARGAAGLCAVLGFWLWGVPQGLTGTVHVNHLLVMYALLAAGPCDAELAVRRGASDRDRAAWAMVLARLMVGVVYLFPGLAKLGFMPYWDDALEQHFHTAQALYAPVQWMPPELVIEGMAFGAIMFEVGFLFAMFTRWRPYAALVAICFHLSTGLLLGIWFQGLWPLLIAFVTPQATWPSIRVNWRYAPAAALVAGAFVMGVKDVDRGWPVSEYPQFDHVPGEAEQSWLIATTADGRRVRATSVLLPNHASGFWAKIEHNHTAAAIEHAVEARLGEPVTLAWERQIQAAA